MSFGSGDDYRPRDYPPVAVTVDVALFAIHRDALHILLVERGVEPFVGAWALPGGFVHPDEDLDAAAARELEEETGVTEEAAYLEQLRSYGSPGRDPRMRVVTIAYWGACATLPAPLGSSDAAHAELVPVSQVEEGGIELAFDHDRIVKDAVERVRAKLEYTALAARFCPPKFTISELRKVYETVWNTKLDPGNFQRKVRENRAFRRLGSSTLSAVAQTAFDSRAEFMEFAEMDADWSGAAAYEAPLADAAPLMEMAYTPPQESGLGQASARAKPRSGRPASLWTVGDSELTLNSPIPRRRASRKA